MRPVHTLAASLRAAFRDRRAATAIEYGLILALIALAVLAGMRGVAGETIEMWNQVSDVVTENTPED